jgi:hypothetical protein
LAGSSPELLVRVHQGKVEYRPIAGSRPRGATEAKDDALAEEMLHDEKERAEHVMLVDLGRNDVGRVSRFGSVKVDKLMFVERYSHIMHIVSSIEGRLRPDLTAVDALRACFPAGTLSGAPKVRAMEIIEELEPARRGTYGGAVLYADFSGNLDSCIAIRSMLRVGGKGSVQAGAGIVADSVPELEHQESLNKAQAVIPRHRARERDVAPVFLSVHCAISLSGSAGLASLGKDIHWRRTQWRKCGIGRETVWRSGSAGLRVLAWRGPHGEASINQRRRDGDVRISARRNQSDEFAAGISAGNEDCVRLSGRHARECTPCNALCVPADRPGQVIRRVPCGVQQLNPVTNYSAPKMRLKNRPILRKNPGFF